MRLTRIWKWLVRPLVLGLLTTIAVAWGLAAWLPQRGWNSTLYWSDGPNCIVFIEEYRAVGAIRRVWNREYPGVSRVFGPFLEPIEGAPGFRQTQGAGPLPKPRWGRTQLVRDHPTSLEEDGCEHATGWPLVALWYRVESVYAGSLFMYSTTVRGGVALHDSSTARVDLAYKIRAIPWCPIWAGLVANTALYSSIWLVLFAVTSKLQCVRRRRRGCCVRCGYSVLGLPDDSPCPECGSGRPKA